MYLGAITTPPKTSKSTNGRKFSLVEIEIFQKYNVMKHGDL